MIREPYPELFRDEPAWYQRSQHVAKRTYELVSFLADAMGAERVAAHYDGAVTHHDSCSGLRELNGKAQPRRRGRGVAGLALKELPGAERCCGFGGLFCIKYPALSAKMVGDKAPGIVRTAAGTVLAGD